MNKKVKDSIIIGFALFAMFFGAGNLIFPVYLGKISGAAYVKAMLGFVITATGLPFLGIIAGMKSGGSFNKLAENINHVFSVIILTALISCIGPLFAIPRTAATTYEMALKPYIPWFNPIIFYAIYFAINIAFVIKPSKVIDTIGSILTPVLLLTLLILIIKCIFVPAGQPVNTNAANVFGNAFVTGYQTMDAIAAVIFSSIVTTSVLSKGYEKERIKMTLISGTIAVAGLGLVYAGLTVVGSQASGLISGDIEKVKLVVLMSQKILGTSGILILGLAVGLACLTTSIGLIATTSQYFSDLTKGKLNYRTCMLLICAISIFIASLGVDKIISLASPVLGILYPVVIILILSKIFEKFIINKNISAVLVYATFGISLFDTLNLFGIDRILKYIPLSSSGFTWLIPDIIIYIVSTVFYSLKENDLSKKAV